MARHPPSTQDALWGMLYWRVIAIILVAAIAFHALWGARGNLVVDAVFVLWTAALYLVTRLRPERARSARLLHGVGTLPILGLYLLLPDTAVPPAQKPLVYVMLAFFPIYHASAMRGWQGFWLALVLALPGALLTLHLPWQYFAALIDWGLAGMMGMGYYRVARELEQERASWAKQALTDPLTGLGNRRALELDYPRYKSLAERQGTNLIFALWDIDKLKEINDQAGHDAGDTHLRQLAAALRAETRPSDVHYRIGGDEFVGLYLGLKNPEGLIERVRRRFPHVSVGWVDARGLDLAQAYQAADRAMYAQKKHRYVQE